MEASLFKFESMGVVAANKPLNSNEIEWVSSEKSPLVDGALSDAGTMYKAKGTDAEGAAFDIQTPTSVSLKATWLPLGNGNRLTAPDVRRGERIIVFRYANTDLYFWQEMPENGIDLRRLETVVFAISATAEENAKTSAENSYYMEMSSHGKLIHLHTSKANGEPYAFDVQLDTKNGIFQVTNNEGCYIAMDCKENLIEMQNNDNSVVSINKKDISITADESVHIKTKRFTVEVEEIKVEASTKATLITKINEITAATKHTGGIQLIGGMKQTPGGGGGGSTGDTVEFNADVKVIGGASFSGTVKVGKLISEQDIDAPNV